MSKSPRRKRIKARRLARKAPFARTYHMDARTFAVTSHTGRCSPNVCRPVKPKQ